MTYTGEGLELRDYIRSMPEWPKPGVIFRDVTPLFGDGGALAQAVHELAAPLKEKGITKVAGIEARGFILGGAVAVEIGAGFIPIRKEGKLPHEADSEEYELEYGSAVIQMHRDAVEKGERIALIDDLIASGGTANAAANLLRRAEAHIVASSFIVDLPELGGAKSLSDRGIPVTTLMSFEGL